MLVCFVLVFADSTVFHSIGYFVVYTFMLLFKSNMWFESSVQCFGLLLKGSDIQALCLLYRDFIVIFIEPK